MHRQHQRLLRVATRIPLLGPDLVPIVPEPRLDLLGFVGPLADVPDQVGMERTTHYMMSPRPPSGCTRSYGGHLLGTRGQPMATSDARTDVLGHPCTYPRVQNSMSVSLIASESENPPRRAARGDITLQGHTEIIWSERHYAELGGGTDGAIGTTRYRRR